MHYCYILISKKVHKFYVGSAIDIKKRITEHNQGLVFSTKPYLPWNLVWFGAFGTKKEAEDFELYLKSGSGRAFAYKRLVSVALAKDIFDGRKSSEALA